MLRKALLMVAVLIVLCGFELRAQSNIDNLELFTFVYKPLVLDRTSNLNFGWVTVGTNGGTVIIAQNGARSNSGDIALVTSTASAANVTITAQDWTWVMITLPNSATLSDGGSNTLSMTFDPSISGQQPTGGTGILEMQIGGTVTVPANTPVGSYTGSVELSVVYY